jgi:hypothetical protein
MKGRGERSGSRKDGQGKPNATATARVDLSFDPSTGMHHFVRLFMTGLATKTRHPEQDHNTLIQGSGDLGGLYHHQTESPS